jgi:anaerobic magnesium-protoporphyrin IX monomethyl ester cyclase
MKIALIEPIPRTNLYFFVGKLPLLGPLYLGTLLKQAGHEVKVFKEDFTRMYNERKDELHPYIREADIVGLTAVTHTVHRAYQIADAIKRQFPDKKVIMGGNHPSARPEEAARHCDHVVVGEAEPKVREIFENPTEKIIRGARPDINDLPILDLSILQDYKRNARSKYRDIAPMSASRGCPHDCIFCSVTQMFGRKVRVRDADLVMEEFKMRYDEGYRFAFFYDDNFAADKTKTKILLEKMIRADLDFEWSSQFDIHVARDPELLEMLKRAKCRTLWLGTESVNPESLKDYHKNQSVEMVKDSIAKIRAAGMRTHSMFILGADSDTEESIMETVRFAKECGTETAQFSVLYPIPGTELYDNLQAQNRIFVDDWKYFDGSHSVVIPKNLTPLKLQKLSIRCYRSFYRTKGLLPWLGTLAGFMVWKLLDRKYMRHLRRVSRPLTLTKLSVRRREKLKAFGPLNWLPEK